MITQERIISIIANALDLKASDITINTKSSDLPDWDSLGHLAILSQITQELGDDFNNSQELASSSSVQEIFDCLSKSN